MHGDIRIYPGHDIIHHDAHPAGHRLEFVDGVDIELIQFRASLMPPEFRAEFSGIALHFKKIRWSCVSYYGDRIPPVFIVKTALPVSPILTGVAVCVYPFFSKSQ